MFYRIIALDIDGTLTNSQKRISPETKQVLMEYQQNGGRLILASGRPTQGVLPYARTLSLEQYGGYILSYNGGCMIDCEKDRVVFQNKLPLRYIPELCEIIKPYPVGINTYEGDQVIVGQQINRYARLECRINQMKMKFVGNFAEYVNFDITKCLLQGEPEVISELEQVLLERYEGELGIFKSEPFFLEIVPPDIDKAKSIDRLLKMLGIPTEACIACGDGFNDITMLQYAGLGVAMSNASRTVQKAADYVTRSNDNNGIAYVLCRLGNREMPTSVRV